MELLLSHTAECFRHQHQLTSWDVKFLDCLGNDPLRVAIGVDIRCIPLQKSQLAVCSNARRDTNSSDSPIIGGLQERERFLGPDNPVSPFRISYTHASNDGDRYA